MGNTPCDYNYRASGRHGLSLPKPRRAGQWVGGVVKRTAPLSEKTSMRK